MSRIHDTSAPGAEHPSSPDVVAISTRELIERLLRPLRGLPASLARGYAERELEVPTDEFPTPTSPRITGAPSVVRPREHSAHGTGVGTPASLVAHAPARAAADRGELTSESAAAPRPAPSRSAPPRPNNGAEVFEDAAPAAASRGRDETLAASAETTSASTTTARPQGVTPRPVHSLRPAETHAAPSTARRVRERAPTTSGAPLVSLRAPGRSTQKTGLNEQVGSSARRDAPASDEARPSRPAPAGVVSVARLRSDGAPRVRARRRLNFAPTPSPEASMTEEPTSRAATRERDPASTPGLRAASTSPAAPASAPTSADLERDPAPRPRVSRARAPSRTPSPGPSTTPADPGRAGPRPVPHLGLNAASARATTTNTQPDMSTPAPRLDADPGAPPRPPALRFVNNLSVAPDRHPPARAPSTTSAARRVDEARPRAQQARAGERRRDASPPPAELDPDEVERVVVEALRTAARRQGVEV